MRKRLHGGNMWNRGKAGAVARQKREEKRRLQKLQLEEAEIHGAASTEVVPNLHLPKCRVPTAATALAASQLLLRGLRQPELNLEETQQGDFEVKMEFEESPMTVVKIEEPEYQDVEIGCGDLNEENELAGTSTADNNDALPSAHDQGMTPITGQIHRRKRNISKLRTKRKTERPPLRPRPHHPSPDFCFVCVCPLSEETRPKITSANCFFLINDLLEMWQTQHYMNEMGAPEKLIGLCDNCHYVITRATELKAQIIKFETDLKKCQRQILETIKGTMLGSTSSSIEGYNERSRLVGRREQREAVAKILKFVDNRKYHHLTLREKRMNLKPYYRKKPVLHPKDKTPKPLSKKIISDVRNKVEKQGTPSSPTPTSTDQIMTQLVAALPPASPSPPVFITKKKEKLKRENKTSLITKRQNLCTKSDPLLPSQGGLRKSASSDISITSKQDDNADYIPEELVRDPLSLEDEVNFCPQPKEIILIPPVPVQYGFVPQPESQHQLLQYDLTDSNVMHSSEEQLRLDTNQLHRNRIPTPPPESSQSSMTSNAPTTSSNIVDLRKVLAANTTTESKYPCPSCDEVYSSKQALYRHKQWTHQRRVCKICGLDFSKPEDYCQHLRTIHPECWWGKDNSNSWKDKV